MSREISWVSEKWEDVETRYKIKSILFEEKSEYQHAQIVDSCTYGRMLLLDGIVQTTEKDEFIYHEMMVHVPMMSHPNPEKVLIIGGGDGGILRETLKYKSVISATMVEIDSKVVDLCSEYMPSLNDGAFKEKRAKLVYEDGAVFVKDTDEKFDVIIIDSPDPIGPARVLFSQAFYLNISGLMNSGGIMVRQTGSVHMQEDEQKEAYGVLNKIFGNTEAYVFAVPTYVGGFFSAMFCSDFINPHDTGMKTLEEKVSSQKIVTKYYNAGIHIGAFHIPHYLKERLI